MLWNGLMALDGVEQFKQSFPLRGRIVELRLFDGRNINDQYIGWLNDPEVVRFSNQRFKRHDETSCSTYLRSFDGSCNLLLAIYMTDSDKFVGTMTAYFSIPHETSDLGILIGDRSSWGRGVGKDAWSTLMSLLLASGRLRKVTGGALRCNIGMVNIMKKCAMEPDGVRVAHELVDGSPQDILYFARFKK
jgi:RimJ/RimL family protein N-acetyltransferase